MSIHKAFLFDYSSFREEIAFYVDCADRGDFAPLAGRVCKALDLLPIEWHFYDLGDGALPSREEILRKTRVSARDAGLWLRIIMSEYLTPCQSPGANWSIVYDYLCIVGWPSVDCDNLFQGTPVYRLLKPTVEPVLDWPLTQDSPYWLWMHPGWAKSGWLSSEESSRFQVELKKLGNTLLEFDVCHLPNVAADNPSVIDDYSKRLATGFENTLKMVSASVERDTGLLMTIKIYA